MSLVSRIWAAIRTPSARFVGRDLQGNKFYERPQAEMGRPKRTVVYHNPDDMWDYIGGNKRLAIQWSAWLSHTRPNAPTLEELQADADRQLRVKHNASLIEARDREESERLQRLQAERRSELLGAPSRGEAAYPTTSEPRPAATTTAQTTEALEGKPDPWAEAAKNTKTEAEAWKPQLRKRGQ